MPLITVFTAPKPFTNPHINCIQRNAIRSWQALAPEVDVLVIGQEEGLNEVACELGFRYLPDVERNASGTPLIRSLFDQARRNSDSPLLAYVNADILLLPDFAAAARQLANQKRFLMVGQRWDLDVTEELEFDAGWDERLRRDVSARGRLHTRGGSDYFVFPRDCFTQIPDLAVGRAGWDNWMLYEARARGCTLVDATPAVQIVHQNHDYSHLPGGQAHYRLPETYENTRMAGGRMVTRFTLDDAEVELVDGRLNPRPWSWGRFWREVEIFPLVRLHSHPLGSLFYAIFHPQRAYRELRARAAQTDRR